MFCQNCGVSIPSDSQFCPACGAKTGTVIQLTPPQYKAPPLYAQQKQVILTDSSSPGAFVLGLLIPIIISIILYISWQKDTPKKAQSLLIGMVIRILPTVVTLFLFFMWIMGS